MKILQINAVYAVGSTGRTVKELTDALKKTEIEAWVATPDAPAENGFYRIGNSTDQKLHALLSRVSGKQAYFSHRHTKKLIDFIKAERFDLVHLRNLHANYIHLPMLLKFLAKEDIPTVITLHDCWFFTGKCTHYVGEGCYKWQTSCGNCPRLKTDNASWFFDRTRKMRKDREALFTAIPRLGVVGVSDWITNEAKKSFLNRAKLIKRIYNWIDTDVFRPVNPDALREELGLDEKPVVLGTAQIWSKNKGLDQFVRLAEKMPDVTFLMVGQVTESTVDLPANMVFVGLVKKTEKLAEYYSLADVFYNPSLYETFGKTMAEAMACGTPVIGYRSTAVAEVIGENGGIVLEPHTEIEKTEDAIRRLLQASEKDCSSLSAYVSKTFDKDKLIEEYVDVYASLVEG